jgi:hypothetical protein
MAALSNLNFTRFATVDPLRTDRDVRFVGRVTATPSNVPKSPFPGNRILRGGDNGVEKALHIQPIVGGDKKPARKPTSSVLFDRLHRPDCSNNSTLQTPGEIQ